MEKLTKVTEQELDNVAGGNDGRFYDSSWRKVANLEAGFLAVRSVPYYDDSNIIGELHNGDSVQLAGSTINGSDGRKYIMIYSPKLGVKGYVNVNYLA